MKVLNIIGADISKKAVDFATPHGVHLKVENRLSGFEELIEWLGTQGFNLPGTMIVMEHTGLYSYQLTDFLRKKEISFTKVSALAIKRSMGLVRGKNDKVDAIRIARYGWEKKDVLRPDPPVSKVMEQLQLLHSTRARLVKQRAGFITAVKECRSGYGLKDKDPVIASQLQIIKSFDRQIAKLNQSIAEIIETEKSIKTNHQLLQSVHGVGQVVATAAIVKTGNFTRFTNAKKFACYCGTAPFEHTSGTSIRGKTRISHLADKEMKSLLDLAAKSAIQHDKELREYYLRRTSAGKPKMSTINVVRNKIIYRMFAVIKRQTDFVQEYTRTA
jgi:transposase